MTNHPHPLGPAPACLCLSFYESLSIPYIAYLDYSN
jgi:hypothetical protein